MIIRSQNKEGIVNFNNIRTIQIEVQKPKDRTMVLEKYETHIVAYGNTNFATLGIYESKEKAIKVLDMICDFYIRMVDVTNNIVQAKKEDSYVFQMPSDEEVEV